VVVEVYDDGFGHHVAGRLRLLSAVASDQREETREAADRSRCPFRATALNERQPLDGAFEVPAPSVRSGDESSLVSSALGTYT
jgi:hypothetical protein